MSATARLMMTRATLHSIATVVALGVSIRALSEADMWVRMMVFALAWVACALAYFGFLYCTQCVTDAVDERIRRALRDQRTVDEMRRYERRLRFIRRWRDDRDGTAD